MPRVLWLGGLMVLPCTKFHPFVQRIKPLLDDEERELKESVAYFQQVSGVFQDAVDGTDNPSPLASSLTLSLTAGQSPLASSLTLSLTAGQSP